MKKFKPHKPPKVSYKPNSLIKHGTSGEELELHNTIRMLIPGVPTFKGDRVVLHGREIDILIPSLKIGIEYNGLFFHSGADKKPGYHLWKTEEAEKAGYKLIHIWSDLWETRRTQTVNYLSKLLNAYKILPIEKCIVDEIDKREGRAFLEATHILGDDSRAEKYFGIFYENNLITVISFSEDWVLLRKSDRGSLGVEGDVEAVISFIKDRYKIERIRAELDRSLFSKKDLKNFKVTGYSKPHTLWTKDFKSRRLQESFTEKELTSTGYKKFYDCGTLYLEYIG